jgi:hypothetical protein
MQAPCMSATRHYVIAAFARLPWTITHALTVSAWSPIVKE